MEGKYESIIKYFTLNLKILKSNNIIIFASSDEIDNYFLQLSRGKKTPFKIIQELLDMTISIIHIKLPSFPELIENSLKIIELVISHRIIPMQRYISDIVKEFDLIRVNFANNENVLCKLLNLSLIMCMSDYVKVSECDLYEVIIFLIQIYTHSQSEQIKSIARLTTDQIINVINHNEPKNVNSLSRIYNAKIFDDVKNNYFSLLIRNIVDRVCIGKNFTTANKIENEKGVLNGKFGWCVVCRNKCDFYNEKEKFAICSLKCEKQIFFLKKIFELEINLRFNNDYENIFAICCGILFKNVFYDEIEFCELCYDVIVKMISIKQSEFMLICIKNFLLPMIYLNEKNELNKKTIFLFFHIFSFENFRKKLFHEIYFFFLHVYNESEDFAFLQFADNFIKNKNLLIETFVNFDLNQSYDDIIVPRIKNAIVAINEIFSKQKTKENKRSIKCIDFIAKLIALINTYELSQSDTQYSLSIKKNIEYKRKIKKLIDVFNSSNTNDFISLLSSYKLILTENEFNSEESNCHSNKTINVKMLSPFDFPNTKFYFFSLRESLTEIITYSDYIAYEIALFMVKYNKYIYQQKVKVIISSAKPFFIKIVYYIINVMNYANMNLSEAFYSFCEYLPIDICDDQSASRAMRILANKYAKDNGYTFDMYCLIEMIREINDNEKQSPPQIDEFINNNKHIDFNFVCDVYNKAITFSNGLIEKYMQYKEILDYDNNIEFTLGATQSDLCELMNLIWSDIFCIFSKMIGLYNDLDIVKECIANILVLARIGGRNKQNEICDACVTAITSMTAEIDSKANRAKAKLCLQALIHFCNVNGEYITSSWQSILQITSQLEISTENIFAFDHIYENTSHYSLNVIRNFLFALCNVSFLEVKSNRTYSLLKLIEVAQANKTRTITEWITLYKIISDYIMRIIAEINNSHINAIAIDVLRQIAIMLLNVNERNDMNEKENFESVLLLPFELIFNAENVNDEIRECMMETVANVVEMSQRINRGWMVVFTIIKSALILKNKKMNKEISHILNATSFEIEKNLSNSVNYKGYIECLCKLYIEEDNEVKSEIISACINLIKSVCKSANANRFEMMGMFFNAFDDIEDVLFDIIDNCKNEITIEDNLFFVYFSSFKANVICLMFTRYKDRASKSEFCDDIAANTIKYLNDTLDVENESVKAAIFKWYSQYDEYAKYKTNKYKKYNSLQYESYFANYIEKVLKVIRVKDSLYFDILISIFALAMYNDSPNFIFRILSENFFINTNRIQNTQWNTIRLIIDESISMITNAKFAQLTFYDLVQFSFTFCSFLLSLAINDYYDVITNENICDVFKGLNKINILFSYFDVNSHFNITTANKVIDMMIIISRLKLIILSKAKDKEMISKREVCEYIDIMYKIYRKYNIEKEDKCEYIKVIVFEIENIVPNVFAYLNEDEKNNIFALIVEFLGAKNLLLRHTVKILIKSIRKNNLFEFVEFNNINDEDN